MFLIQQKKIDCKYCLSLRKIDFTKNPVVRKFSSNSKSVYFGSEVINYFLDNLNNTLQTNIELTKQCLLAKICLIEMIDSLPKDSLLISFLKNNYIRKLTYLNKFVFDVKTNKFVLQKNKLFALPISHSNLNKHNYLRESGVYIFQSKLSSFYGQNIRHILYARQLNFGSINNVLRYLQKPQSANPWTCIG